jgi:four helix bundle protein
MSKLKYDLNSRTEDLGRAVILYCKNIKQDAISRPMISQLVRSATSVGANYAEANAASSRKDFRNKIYICKKELQETLYWLDMMKEIDKSNSVNNLEKETIELTKIFGKILSTLRKKELLEAKDLNQNSKFKI